VTGTALPVNRNSVLFFSRGRGRGHAIPDLEVLRELKEIDGRLEIQFASYATGAATFKSEGHDVIDLGLPEANSFVETTILAHQIIQQVQPAVVISHEEFAALVAARLANLPSIFVCAWLPPVGSVAAESLVGVQDIIIIEEPGLFPVPPGVTARPHYVGPIVRKMKYGLADRPRLRKELGIEPDVLAILVVPSGAMTEEIAPISETVLAAFRALNRPQKRLYWLAGRDFDRLRKRTAGLPGVEVMEYYTPVERLIVCCDVVITKGTQQITLETASLGVPSISLSPGLNPIDEVLIPRERNNIALKANAVDGDTLVKYIDAVTSRPPPPPDAGPDRRGSRAAELAAARIVETIRRVTA
jgi:UDP-N-acetylglucosamine:LPS N-acetylglucosamine transferase